MGKCTSSNNGCSGDQNRIRPYGCHSSTILNALSESYLETCKQMVQIYIRVFQIYFIVSQWHHPVDCKNDCCLAGGLAGYDRMSQVLGSWSDRHRFWCSLLRLVILHLTDLKLGRSFTLVCLDFHFCMFCWVLKWVWSGIQYYINIDVILTTMLVFIIYILHICF